MPTDWLPWPGKTKAIMLILLIVGPNGPDPGKVHARLQKSPPRPTLGR